VLTILTPGEVGLSVSVDEEEFLSKLGVHTGEVKAQGACRARSAAAIDHLALDDDRA
jgi:hypothetical protein